MTRQINLDEPRAWICHCGVCGYSGKIRTEFDIHHITYFPEKTIMVCHKCHMKIHRTRELDPWQIKRIIDEGDDYSVSREKQKLLDLKPPWGDSRKFYKEKLYKRLGI